MCLAQREAYAEGTAMCFHVSVVDMWLNFDFGCRVGSECCEAVVARTLRAGRAGGSCHVHRPSASLLPMFLPRNPVRSLHVAALPLPSSVPPPPPSSCPWVLRGLVVQTRPRVTLSEPHSPPRSSAGSRTGHRHLLMATSPKANSCNHLLTKWAFLLNSSIFDSVFLSSIYKIIAIFI